MKKTGTCRKMQSSQGIMEAISRRKIRNDISEGSSCCLVELEARAKEAEEKPGHN